MNIGEAVVPALESVGEPGVIEAQGVEEGGVKVVDVDGVLGDMETEWIGFSVGDAPFHSAACGPHGEGLGMVIPAQFSAQFGAALDHGGAAEFPAPDDERVIQEAALLEVLDEGGIGLIGGFALGGDATFDIGVVVPGFVEELDEANAAFDEASGEEAIVRVGSLAGFGSIEVEDVFGFAGQIDQFRCAELHPVGHFEAVDPGIDLGVSDDAEFVLVEFLEGVEGLALEVGADAGWVGEVEDRVAGLPERDALIDGGEEAAAEITGPAAEAAGGVEHDERGEVLGNGAETVGGPGAEAGSPEDLGPGVHENLAGGMVEGVGLDGADDGEIIYDLGQVWQGFGEFGTGLSVTGELEFRGIEFGVRLDEGVLLAHDDLLGNRLAVPAGEVGLMVEEIELGGCARLEEVDDAFCGGFEVGRFWGEGVGGGWAGSRGGGGLQEGAKGEGAESEGAVAKEPASGEEASAFLEEVGKVGGIHGGR